MNKDKNKVMITIIIIIGVILSAFPVSQIIKKCNGQNPKIEKEIEKLESPSSINNPFKKDCITDITLFKRKNFSDEYYYAGYINFEYENTKGEMRFEGESLEDVYNQIHQFCESL
jgi:hypothetical protein